MGTLLNNFWKTTMGPWMLGILGSALIIGAAASVKSQVDIAVMQTNLDNYVISNAKTDSLFNANLAEIKTDVRELRAFISNVGDIKSIETDVDKIEAELKKHELNRSIHK